MFADFSDNKFENFDDSICDHDLMRIHPKSNCLATNNPFRCEAGDTKLVRCPQANDEYACHARPKCW